MDESIDIVRSCKRQTAYVEIFVGTWRSLELVLCETWLLNKIYKKITYFKHTLVKDLFLKSRIEEERTQIINSQETHISEV